MLREPNNIHRPMLTVIDVAAEGELLKALGENFCKQALVLITGVDIKKGFGVGFAALITLGQPEDRTGISLHPQANFKIPAIAVIYPGCAFMGIAGRIRRRPARQRGEKKAA